MVHCRNSVVVACGDETQQELIPFKHKESWVVGLALSELTVTEIEGSCKRRTRARDTSEIVAYTLK